MQHIKIKGMWLAALLAWPMAGFAADSGTNVVWKNNIALGATYKDGNTDQTLFTLNLKGDRTSPKNDWINSLHAEYGKTDGEQTQGQVRGQSDWRYKFGGKNFYGGAFGEAYYDDIKEIRTRLKLGPQIGYYFINKETMKLDISGGLNYVYERTAASEGHFGEFRLAGNYLWDFSEVASYYLNAEYSVNVEDADDGNGLLVTGLKTKMNEQLSLFIELRDEYDNSPATETTEYNDITIIAGLGYDF